jgi:hypothetical protein
MVINRYHIIGLVLYTTLIVILTYLLTRPNTTVDGLTADQQRAVDSLNVRIGELESKQRASDSLITKYEYSIGLLDYQIDSTKNKVLQIRKHYDKKIKDISKYTPTKLDSFFSDRYHNHQ